MQIFRIVLALAASLLAVLPARSECAGRTIADRVYALPVCVPEKPQRVVILDYFYNLGMAFELGIPVIGAPLLAAPDAELRKRAEDASVVDIGDARQPNLERIVALKPDLIIGDSQFHNQFYTTLAQIAPTALIDATNWKDHLVMLAEIAGHSDAATEMLRAYTDRVTALRRRVTSDTEVSVIRIAPHGFHVYLDGPSAYAPYSVLHEAGVRRTSYETTTDDTVLKRPDWEEIEALRGDILFYVAAAGNLPGQDDALVDVTITNPFWQMLRAVQAGRAYRVDKAHWFGFNSVKSAHRVLDDIERYILNAP